MNLQLVILGQKDGDAAIDLEDDEFDNHHDLEDNPYWVLFQNLKKLKPGPAFEKERSQAMSEFLAGCKAIDPEGPGCLFCMCIGARVDPNIMVTAITCALEGFDPDQSLLDFRNILEAEIEAQEAQEAKEKEVGCKCVCFIFACMFL